MFATYQSLGIFTGGFGAGILLEVYGQQGVFAGAITIVILWLVIVACSAPGRRYTDHWVSVPAGFNERSTDVLDDSLVLTGIKQARYVKEKSAVYLKIDESKVDRKQLELLLASFKKRVG